MSRHRDIRNMDYSEDYDGYDDVYGHSVDDDIFISPSHRQFMYDRESSGQSKIDFAMEQDIQEEDEPDEEINLSEEDKVKLESCLDYVRSVFAPMRMPRPELVKVIVSQKFDCEKIVSCLLKSQSSQPTERKDKDETILLFKSSHQLFGQSINENKKAYSQHVEPQSEVFSDILSEKIRTHNTPNNSKSDKRLLDHGHRSNSSSIKLLERNNYLTMDTPDFNVSNTFLSKIKKCQNPSEIGSDTEKESPLVSNFLSKVNSKGKHTNEKITPATSFFSTIPKSGNGMQKDVSYDFLNKLKKRDDLETRNPENSSGHSSPIIQESKSFGMCNQMLASTSLNRKEKSGTKPNLLQNIEDHSECKMNSIGAKHSLNKLNMFLSKIDPKESTNVLKQSKSDVSSSILKYPNLCEDFPKLRLNDVKSVPLIGNKENNVFHINLTTALQKNNYENLKFRPSQEEKKFDLPFMGNEEMDEDETVLECTMDLSNLARKRVLYTKTTPSPLGRMLCLRFKIHKDKPYRRTTIKNDSRLTKFNFMEPSPDDQIKKHIKRNL